MEASCAPEPAGLVYAADLTGGDSAPSRSLYAWCPAGRKVLGVGGRVTAADSSKVFLTSVKPTGTGNGAEVGAVEVKGGYVGTWWLHSWTIWAYISLSLGQVYLTKIRIDSVGAAPSRGRRFRLPVGRAGTRR